MDRCRGFGTVSNHHGKVKELASDAEIVEATLDSPPIAGRTDVWNTDAKTRTNIE